MLEPFRLEMNVTLAAESVADAARLWDALVALLPPGAEVQGGGISEMDRVDVVPDSPLAVALQ